MSRAAVFLDRDGTVIEDTGFVRSPDQVRLLPGAADAIRRLREAGHIVVVVTNQSGIGRGILTMADYDAVAARLADLLAQHGTTLDATYLCPHHPDVTGPCDCRKPGPHHYQAAATRFGLDLKASVWVGDRMSDIRGAAAFGGQGLLVRTGQGTESVDEAIQEGYPVVSDLREAADVILGRAERGAGSGRL